MSRSLSPWQALILGSAVLVGLSLATLGLFAVGNRQWLWTDTFHLRVGFRQIHGVERGTPVRVFGRNAGEIEDVQMPDSPDGQVTLVLRMDGKLHSLIRTDAFAQIVPVGMVGGKVLEINPGSKEAAVVEDNAVIASRPVNDPIDEAAKVLETLNQEKANVHELVNNTNTLVRQGQKTLASVQQATDAVKRLPGVSSYVEDANELLYRPNCERSPTWFAESELFAPGRAQLTDEGRQRLRELVPQLSSLTKNDGAEMVILAYADRKTTLDAEQAQVLTQKQSEAVRDFLKQAGAVYKKYWVFPRKVRLHGFGLDAPPVAERDNPPGPALGILVFVPQK
jgi:phospholipid/cholesterol/gamma-HCH transport system substrate-binding protein